MRRKSSTKFDRKWIARRKRQVDDGSPRASCQGHLLLSLSSPRVFVVTAYRLGRPAAFQSFTTRECSPSSRVFERLRQQGQHIIEVVRITSMASERGHRVERSYHKEHLGRRQVVRLPSGIDASGSNFRSAARRVPEGAAERVKLFTSASDHVITPKSVDLSEFEHYHTDASRFL
jgi:hypothetical protein